MLERSAELRNNCVVITPPEEVGSSGSWNGNIAKNMEWILQSVRCVNVLLLYVSGKQYVIFCVFLLNVLQEW